MALYKNPFYLLYTAHAHTHTHNKTIGTEPHECSADDDDACQTVRGSESRNKVRGRYTGQDLAVCLGEKGRKSMRHRWMGSSGCL